MKRKIVYAGAAWGTGLLLASFLHPAYDFILLLLALILFLCMKYLFKLDIKKIILILCVLSVSVGYYRMYDTFVYKNIADYSGENVSFSGKILEFTDYSGDKSSYLVKGKVNGNSTAKISVYSDSVNCRINDNIYFEGTLKVPENSYLFGQKDYYKSKGIYLVSDEISMLKVTENNSFSLVRILGEYREKVSAFIDSCLEENESAMLKGMLFGDKSGLSDDDKTLFYRTGIGHIMAVSGLHLVLFCGLFSYAFKKMKFGRKSTFILTELMMLLFAVCSGLSPSVLRAALMMTIVNAAPLFFRYPDTLNSICISLIALTIGCPFSMRNPSLVLSLTGAFSAGVFAPFITDKMKNDTIIQKYLKQAAYIFCVSLAIFPVSVIFFGEGSFISPLANIFLTPICMAALLLALISALTLFIHPVLLIKISGLMCRLVLNAVRLMGRQKFSYMNFSDSLKILSAVLIVFCIVTYFVLKNYRMEITAVIISVVIFLAGSSVYNFVDRKDLKIAILGDGKTDVIVISNGFTADIIDLTGRKNNVRYLNKFLTENNISQINNIIIKSAPYQAMALYNKQMTLFRVNRMFLPHETYLRSDSKLCGLYPEFTDFRDLNFKYNDYIISIADTTVKVYFGNFSFVCDSSLNTVYSSVYAEYENVFEPPDCRTLIVPEYENADNSDIPSDMICKSNVVIKAGNDGEFSVGGL